MSITKSRQILIIDDSMLWLEKLSLILADERVGNVATAKSFDEALPMFEWDPDIIVLDIHLPGKNGIEILKFVKTNYARPKVCMVSNSINTYTYNMLMCLGADATFDKAIEFEKILDFILNNLSSAND